MKEEEVAQFVKEHGIACGGNWAAMFMSAIRRGLPEVFEAMEDKQYDFVELQEVIADNTGDGDEDTMLEDEVLVFEEEYRVV